MTDKEALEEELFCLRYELNTLAEQVLKQQSERWVPGFLYASTEHSHTSRYKLASQYSKGKDVIDIACGTGRGSWLMATEGAAKSVDGFDLQPDAIRYARWRSAAANTSFAVADAENIYFAEKYDLAVSFETVEHLRGYQKFVANLHACLRPDGLVLISTPLSPHAFDNKPGNPYHTQEWGFQEFHDIFKEHFLLEKVYLQLYPAPPAYHRPSNFLLRVLSKLKRTIKRRPSQPVATPAAGAFSIIEEYTGQYPVEELGKSRIGYQIILGRKKKA